MYTIHEKIQKKKRKCIEILLRNANERIMILGAGKDPSPQKGVVHRFLLSPNLLIVLREFSL